MSPEECAALEQAYAHIDAPKLFISAKSRIGLDTLESHLIEAAALPDISQSDVIVTNARHYEALTHALDAIRRVQDGLAMNLSGDFVSQDLRECIHHLSDIVGEVSTDSVLQNIFKHFCIGKWGNVSKPQKPRKNQEIKSLFINTLGLFYQIQPFSLFFLIFLCFCYFFVVTLLPETILVTNFVA